MYNLFHILAEDNLNFHQTRTQIIFACFFKPDKYVPIEYSENIDLWWNHPQCVINSKVLRLHVSTSWSMHRLNEPTDKLPTNCWWEGVWEEPLNLSCVVLAKLQGSLGVGSKGAIRWPGNLLCQHELEMEEDCVPNWELKRANKCSKHSVYGYNEGSFRFTMYKIFNHC